MARPLRFEYKGALYHVYARGNERRKIFFTDTKKRGQGYTFDKLIQAEDLTLPISSEERVEQKI